MSDRPARASIIVSENLAERMPELSERYPDVRFPTVPLSGGDLLPEYTEADGMFRSAMDEDLFDAILKAAPNLRWVQISAAGFDWMGGPVLEGRIAEGMVVTRSGRSLNVTMAEYVVGAMLSLARCFPAYQDAQRRCEWIRLVGTDVGGSTVAVFGTGAIGEEVAWRARALGATVVGVNRTGTEHENFDRVIDRHSFREILPEADFVVLAMPLTPETEGLFGAAEFAAMNSSSFLINVGRGALTDEHALVEALETEQIAGAFIDVFVEEPLPPDSPIWSAKNAVVTPHTSFRSTAVDGRLYDDFCANLDRFLAGEQLEGTKRRPELGY